MLSKSVELILILSSQIHHFLDFVKQIYKDLPKVVVSSGCMFYTLLAISYFDIFLLCPLKIVHVLPPGQVL